jgi:hypothetical protein
MKALLIGFVFLIFVAILAGIGLLLFPLLIALVWFLRIIFIIILFLLAVWLLGKLIIFVWEKVK